MVCGAKFVPMAGAAHLDMRLRVPANPSLQRDGASRSLGNTSDQ
jgi:hypothetical protein